jgi:hypothetical protein
MRTGASDPHRADRAHEPVVVAQLTSSRLGQCALDADSTRLRRASSYSACGARSTPLGGAPGHHATLAPRNPIIEGEAPRR